MIPVSSESSTALRRRGKRWRWVVVMLAVGFIAFSVATARLFIWPTQGMPARVSAIIMMNGPGDRLDTALLLGWQHRASFLVIARGSEAYGHGSDCAPRIPRVKMICFDPSPATTQGEAEFAGRLAQRYHWRSVALVTITSQGSRARIRMTRCFRGPVYLVTVPIALTSWPYQIAYEWGALVKALVIQRGC